MGLHERSELNKVMPRKKKEINTWLSDLLLQYMSKEFQLYNYAKFYAFTISPHNKKLIPLMLHEAAKTILISYNSCYSLRYIIETSKTGKEHIHGVLITKDQCKFAKLRRHPHVKYHFQHYNDSGWLEYMQKDNPNRIYTYYKNPLGQRQGQYSSDIQSLGIERDKYVP